MRKKIAIRAYLAVALILCVVPACADDRNLLPKYGSAPKEEWQKKADAAFLAATDEEYHGDRKRASNDAAARGWQYLHQGNLDDAMRRFNQAWLLNDHNGAALWGMAAIEAGTGKFKESLKLFAEAEPFAGDDINFSIDHAKALGMAGAMQHDDAMLKDAFDRFARIHQKAPQSTNNLQNWAITLFHIGKYAEAWAKIKLAEATPNKDQLDPRFLAALQERLPRPKD